VLTLSMRKLMEGAAQADGAHVGESFSALFEAPAVLRFEAPVSHGERIAALLHELSVEFADPGAGTSPVVGWLARAVVWRLAQARALQQRARSGPPRQEALFTRFVALVERYHLEHWPVTRYAQRLGLSAERLNRIVRASAQRSALEHIHERLLREACRRLIYIAAPVSTLAFELGFEDPAYFCRFFKRHLGLSPSRYRASRQTG
jgi:AraC family transcriptional activator of pobA